MLLAFYYVLMFIGLNKVHADDNNVEQAVVTQVEDEPHDADLSNIELGSDPTLPLKLSRRSHRGRERARAGGSDGGRRRPRRPEDDAAERAGAARQRRRHRRPASSRSTRAAASWPGTPGGYRMGIMVAGGFGGRSGSAARSRCSRTAAATPNPRRAVARGLLWFACHQAPDGHWSLNDFQRFAHPRRRLALLQDLRLHLHRTGRPPGRHRRHRLRPAALPGRRLHPQAQPGPQADRLLQDRQGRPGLPHRPAGQGRLLRRRHVLARPGHHRHVRGLRHDLRPHAQERPPSGPSTTS